MKPREGNAARHTVDVSVIVPVLNGGHELMLQLSALAHQRTGVRWEVLVCDNGSQDGTRERVGALSAEQESFVLIDASDAPGAAHARNAGARAARGAILAFCDADDVVDPTWVHAMHATVKPNEIVGGRLRRLDHQGTEPPQHVALPEFYRRPYALTASMAVDHETFWRLGGFDERFAGAGFEDVDFAWRAAGAGVSVRFEPSASVGYRQRADVTSARRQALSYARASRTFFDIHGRPGVTPTLGDFLASLWTLVRQVGAALVRHRQVPLSLRMGALYLLAQTRYLMARQEFWRLSKAYG